LNTLKAAAHSHAQPPGPAHLHCAAVYAASTAGDKSAGPLLLLLLLALTVLLLVLPQVVLLQPG
jgi:hypothetical protein